jgi:hypothetical protein
MTELLDEPTYHSRADFESAMSKLSLADRMRLNRVGLKYSGGSGMSPDDLIAEAYVRAMATTRNWPVGISAVRFMAEAMRSIASGERDSIKAEIEARPLPSRSTAEAETEFLTDREGVVLEFVRREPSAEQDLIDREDAAAGASKLAKWRADLLAAFEDDFPAQLIVEGMMDGLRGKALQELSGLSSAEFPTKYKKVSRRIDVLTIKRGTL